jgi:hypothetical protein
LKIKTSFKVDDVENGLSGGGTIGSGKSPDPSCITYSFPFHRRSRSLSPPKDDILFGSFNSNTDAGIDQIKGDMKIYMGSGPMPKIQVCESAFPKAN